jgi:hypothetical protein
MKIQYKTIGVELIGSPQVPQLDTLVNKALEEGWELYGNPFSISTSIGNPRIFQAVIKKSE